MQRADNVEFIWDSAVVALLGENKLSAVRVKNLKSGAERDIPCDGLFISIGRKPATELVKGQLELDDAGYIVAGEDTGASIPGVFAAGDVRAKAVRQIVTATADGASAAYGAERFLAGD